MRKWFALRKKAKTELIIMENMPEYTDARIRAEFTPSQYLVQSIVIDPLLLEQSCARARIYIVVMDMQQLSWDSSFTLQDTFEKLRRRSQLSASDYFWNNVAATALTPWENKQLDVYTKIKADHILADLHQKGGSTFKRFETKDCCLPTLTANSGAFYNFTAWLVWPHLSIFCLQKHKINFGKSVLIVMCFSICFKNLHRSVIFKNQ